MLRPLDHVSGAPYLNGSFIRVLNVNGSAERTGFFAYDSRFKGSSTVISTADKTIVADKTNVTVYDSAGNTLSTFAPFGAAWKNGMSLALGDINGDGKKEMRGWRRRRRRPLVKIFDLAGNLKSHGTSYTAAFRAA